MREIIVAGNWKMNGLTTDFENYFRKFIPEIKDIKKTVVVICPPFTVLQLCNTYKSKLLFFGGQNCYFEEKGAFTGEISPKMLIDCGCNFVILGHSERRIYLKESNEIISKKVKLSIKLGLRPILCVGELLEEREKGKTESVIKRQVTECLQLLSIEEVKRTVIAYEPVWAIGTGKVASPSDACNVISLIRNILQQNCNGETSNSLSILYGGSVNEENIEEMMKEEMIDGVLVGGASLKPLEFAEIVKKTERIKFYS